MQCMLSRPTVDTDTGKQIRCVACYTFKIVSIYLQQSESRRGSNLRIISCKTESRTISYAKPLIQYLLSIVCYTYNAINVKHYRGSKSVPEYSSSLTCHVSSECGRLQLSTISCFCSLQEILIIYHPLLSLLCHPFTHTCQV